MLKITAKATILATGGGAGLFSEHLVSAAEAGEGYALADRAGAELTNLEFIQFMLGLKCGPKRSFLPLNALQAPSKIINAAGDDLLAIAIPDHKTRSQAIMKRQNHYPFSSRDESCLVDLAVARIRAQGATVYWHDDNCKTAQAEVVHYAHAFNGGITINAQAESTISGLFAAGEAAAGCHGADRIGGCMMTATQVFGARAGKFAALRAKAVSALPSEKEIFPNVKKIAHTKGQLESNAMFEAYHAVQETFTRHLGVLRDAKHLKSCLKEIRQAEVYINKMKKAAPYAWLKIAPKLSVMRLITTAALKREKSLGAHYRSDTSLNC